MCECAAIGQKQCRGEYAYKKSMDVGKEDGQLAAGAQQLGQFDGRNKVTAVRSSGGCSVIVTGQHVLSSFIFRNSLPALSLGRKTEIWATPDCQHHSGI